MALTPGFYKNHTFQGASDQLPTADGVLPAWWLDFTKFVYAQENIPHADRCLPALYADFSAGVYWTGY